MPPSHEIAVYARLTNADRVFWIALSRIWRQWANALILVKPGTVVRWHRRGFRYYWRWRSRAPRRTGRRRVDREQRALIRRIATENPTWGAPRIHGELLKLGFQVRPRSSRSRESVGSIIGTTGGGQHRDRFGPRSREPARVYQETIPACEICRVRPTCACMGASVLLMSLPEESISVRVVLQQGVRR